MRSRDEFQLQCSYVRWIESRLYEILYSASCGGMRTGIRTAKNMKMSGYKKGCPDIMIFEPRGGYHGLMIELKAKNGVTTKDQVEWQNNLEIRGYKAYIMPKGLEHQEGLEWLIKKTEAYLGVNTNDWRMK